MNQFTGSVNVNQGELILNSGNNANPLGTNGSRTITIASGATLTANGDNPFSTGANAPLVVVNGTMKSARYQHMNHMDMTAGTITPSGSQVDGLDFRSAATVNSYSSSTSSVIASKMTLNNGTVTFNVEDGSAATDLGISGVMVGSRGIIKTGAGTLTLSGANSYSGATAVSVGTLKLQNTYASSGFSVASGAVLELNGGWNGATTTFSGTGTLRKTGAGTSLWGAGAATFALGSGSLIDVQEGEFTGGSNANEVWTSNLSDLNVASGATFSTVEANARVNKITGTGTIKTGYNGAGYTNFTIGVDNGSSTFGGSIQNSASAGNLVKTGSGSITLSGNNTYTGGTTVDSGILELSGSTGGTGRIRGPLTVNAGAEVRLTNGDGTGFGTNDARISSLSINGGAVSSAGTLHIWNLAGGVTLTGGSLSSNDGVSSATGPQIEWGNTTLTSNASADTATVAGRINIRRDAAPMLRVNVADGAAATDLLISAALTESGSGCGLVKSGAGTLKLGGAVNLTGFLTVNAGTLDLSSATLGEGARINVLPGAKFIPPVSGLPVTAALYINGGKLAPGTWGAPGSVAAGLAQNESPVIRGFHRDDRPGHRSLQPRTLEIPQIRHFQPLHLHGHRHRRCERGRQRVQPAAICR